MAAITSRNICYNIHNPRYRDNTGTADAVSFFFGRSDDRAENRQSEVAQLNVATRLERVGISEGSRNERNNHFRIAQARPLLLLSDRHEVGGSFRD